jgi:hypothetical protein
MSPRTSLDGKAVARRPLPTPLRVHPLWLLAPGAPDEFLQAQLELQLLLLALGLQMILC